MARQRFIWPDLWTDPNFGALADKAKLVFIALFSLADDEGRILADAPYLKATILPYGDDTFDDVAATRDEVAASMPNVHLYRAGGHDYIQLAKWGTWQKPKYPKPSRLPAPSPQPVDNPETGSPTEIPPLTSDSANVPETVPQRSAPGWDGMGWDGMGVRTPTPTASPQGPNFATAARAIGAPGKKAAEHEVRQAIARYGRTTPAARIPWSHPTIGAAAQRCGWQTICADGPGPPGFRAAYEAAVLDHAAQPQAPPDQHKHAPTLATKGAT